MDEKRANEKGLSEERLESSPEVDKGLYKRTQLINKNFPQIFVLVLLVFISLEYL